MVAINTIFTAHKSLHVFKTPLFVNLFFGTLARKVTSWVWYMVWHACLCAYDQLSSYNQNACTITHKLRACLESLQLNLPVQRKPLATWSVPGPTASKTATDTAKTRSTRLLLSLIILCIVWLALSWLVV